MDPITWEDARANLIALTLPAVLLDVFEQRDIPELLQWEFRDPYELFESSTIPSLPVDYAVYPPGRITPLWSIHTGGVVVGYRHEGGLPGFLRFPLECRDGEVFEEGLSYPQSLVAPLVSIWEGEEEESEAESAARRAAALLEFPDIDRLLASLASTPRPSSGEHDAWYAAFLKTLPAHPGR